MEKDILKQDYEMQACALSGSLPGWQRPLSGWRITSISRKAQCAGILGILAAPAQRRKTWF
jgi:hypothetical protein